MLLIRLLFIFLVFAASIANAQNSRERVLFMGSSTIDRWSTLQDDFPDYDVVNEGISGTTYADLTRRAGGWVQEHRPDQVVLYSGDNDLSPLFRGFAPEEVVHRFQETVAHIRRAKSDTRLLVISVKPSPARAYLFTKIVETNRQLRIAAARLGVVYVDVFSRMLDESGRIRRELFEISLIPIHMNRNGYAIWTKTLNEHLTALPSPTGF